MFEKKIRKPVVIDLFAGCGGLSLGLEFAGFKPILVNELVDDARETYILNRKDDYSYFSTSEEDDPENPWVWKDVASLRTYLELKFKKFTDSVQKVHGLNVENGDIDLVVGGPPCQGYSGIGIRRSYSVDKHKIPSNHMYEHMVAIISIIKPKIFLFENVKGLLTSRWYKNDSGSKKGDIWISVRKTFKNILGDEYYIGWHLVHGYEYGIPQNRPRVLLIGIKKSLGWVPLSQTLDDDGMLIFDKNIRAGGLLPDPIYGFPTLKDLLGDLVDDNYSVGGTTTRYPKPASSTIQRQLRQNKTGTSILKKGALITDHQYSKHTQNSIEKFTFMLNNNGNILDIHKTKKFSQRLLPEIWKSNKPNITACSAPDDYVHFSQPRILTVREWARLQTFPDWYQFSGKRTTGGLRRAGNPHQNLFDRETPKYTQIGNAVPVRLAEEIGIHFINILNIIKKENN